LSRFEGDFAAAGEGPLDPLELLDLRAAYSSTTGCDRREAIACYLSAGEGWDEALKALRGAFASEAAAAVRNCGKGRNKREINQRASEYLQWPGLKPAGTDND
jgi:hypothetical protein